jgi:NADH:ubiquinone oxidoreductase subunit F (NADH-binding)
MSARSGLPRLLAGLSADGLAIDLEAHMALHGRLPRIDAEALLRALESSGLRGRGGAGFPTATKLRAVMGSSGRLRGRPSAVIVNGSETEPLSGKDRLLLSRQPHLVLDGAVITARAIGAEQVIVKVGRHGERVLAPLAEAIAQRTREQLPITLALSGSGYIAGEESAVINFLASGKSLPTFDRPRPAERGHANRPTLIQNAETFAHIALIARHGPGWFRELGTAEDPGSVLVTVSGDVRRPGVIEVELGTTLGELLELAGGCSEPPQALLVGGYFGAWVRASSQTLSIPLSRRELGAQGLALGSGILVALGRSGDGMRESARVASYLARESSGQCGPCVNGLAAVAESMARLAAGTASAGELPRLRRWCQEISGRGACHHPTGAVRYVSSALETFMPDSGARDLGTGELGAAHPGDRLQEVA